MCHHSRLCSLSGIHNLRVDDRGIVILAFFVDRVSFCLVCGFAAARGLTGLPASGLRASGLRFVAIGIPPAVLLEVRYACVPDRRYARVP
jgi:hypothetical protein